jgi:glycosyltransferase involved in cell wall biosynthesis
VRVLLWHGWLLEGSGSNVYTAKVAEVMRRAGHDVLVMCQEPHPERHAFIDAWGTIGPRGPSRLQANPAVSPAPGRAVLLRPEIGRLLPVFVLDEYEGRTPKRFVDLSDRELAGYLDRNVDALRAAVEDHRPDLVVAGHAIPGPVIAARAVGPGRFVSKIHGSDIEYAVRDQQRYRTLATEGLEASAAIVGASRNVLGRLVALVPKVVDRVHVVPPGVDAGAFRPLHRPEALLEVAARLDRDPDTARGRSDELDRDVSMALSARDPDALDRLALTYDQEAPDPGAAARLRALAPTTDPVVGFIGKLIPQKGVELAIQALAGRERVRGLIVGFGRFREWLVALSLALDAEDPDALAWLAQASPMQLETTRPRSGLRRRLHFTGRLDHRYAPFAAAAFDVLVVPSILDEAFGMVAVEGAAAGALPLVARHSGLAEIAAALEAHVDRPGLFGFETGPGAVDRLGRGIDALLGLPAPERAELRSAVSAFASKEWSWERTAELLLRFGRDRPEASS